MSYQHTVTSLPEENEYPKLVRDLIPTIIKHESGREVPIRVLDDQEFEKYLRLKAIEEATELAHADTDHNLLEEIADVREILDELAKLKGFSYEEVAAVQIEKRKKRGGFTGRLLMENNDE